MERSLSGSLAVRAASGMFRGYSSLIAHDFARSARQAEAAQATVLRRLTAATARTAYGRHHGIDTAADYQTWRAKLPVVEWSDLEPWISQERERPGQLVADPVTQWVRSRCRTCPDKLIPYTSALKRSFARALTIWGHDLLAAGLRLRTGYCYLEIDPPEVRWAGHGDLAEDSDYVARPLAALLRHIVVVDPRIRLLRSSADFQRVLALSLIASAELEVISIFHPIELAATCAYIHDHRAELAEILDEGRITCEGQTFELARLSAPRRAALLAGDLVALWPALKLVSTPAEHDDAPSARRLGELLPHALHQGKGILTSEAPLTIPLKPAGGWVPVVDEVFYELEADDGTIHRLQDARLGPEYTLVISQAGGLVRYRTGERVRVTHRWHALPCLLHVAYA